MIPGVCQKGGATYRRFKVKRDGRWADHYVKLPDPSDPGFAAELARVNGTAPERARPMNGTIGALAAEFRPLLAKRDMAPSTRSAWHYYLQLIEDAHGHRLVDELERAHCYRIRDGMAGEPGKANNYMAKFKALLEFGAERGWIRTNPAAGIPLLDTGEHEPWPADVLARAIEAASPMLRLAIVTGLCSGQRISDCILMQHNWHDRRMMNLKSKKTATAAFIPMHPLWLAEIDAAAKKAVTILYDRAGKPFADTDRLQAQIRRLMRELGEVHGEGPREGQPLYTFHGLGKNAICYLTELGLDEGTIGALVGKTAETVRHYAKEARRWMLAQAAASTVIAGRIEGLGGRSAEFRGRVANSD